jgi:hypothetical protein
MRFFRILVKLKHEGTLYHSRHYFIDFIEANMLEQPAQYRNHPLQSSQKKYHTFETRTYEATLFTSVQLPTTKYKNHLAKVFLF